MALFLGVCVYTVKTWQAWRGNKAWREARRYRRGMQAHNYLRAKGQVIPVQLTKRCDGSKMLRQLDYDPDTQILVAEFPNGGRYEYLGVPMDIWVELCDATSVGSTFSRLVKGGGYMYNRI